MSEGSEKPRKSWYRKGRNVDISNIPIGKIEEAAKRGIRIDITKSNKGKLTADVNKIIIKGDDER